MDSSMYVDSSSAVVAYLIPSSQTARTGGANTDFGGTEGLYRKEISSISPGSFVTAYQAIRALEVGTFTAMSVPTPENAAILSGVGVPGALRAYDEVLGND
jgi:hypothetical protein